MSKLRDLLNEKIGPETPFGKHSKYYVKGDSVVVITKKGDEEYPQDIQVDLFSKRTIFEDSKGNIKLSFRVNKMTDSKTAMKTIPVKELSIDSYGYDFWD